MRVVRRLRAALRDDALFVGVVALYLVLRVWSFAGILGRDVFQGLPDTVDYEAHARLSAFSLDFYTGYRPAGLPLLYKLLPGDSATVVPIAQWLVACASWLALAFAFRASLEGRVTRTLGPAIVLAFSLVPAVAIWDGVLLTESLSTSLGVLLLASLLALFRTERSLFALTAVGAALALALLRDTNAYFQLLLILPLAAVYGWRWRWSTAAFLASAAIVVFGLSALSHGVRRWERAMVEVIALRVLPNQTAKAYFVAHGMPMRPNLAEDLTSNRAETRFATAPELAFFRPWFYAESRETYVRYLLSHPVEAFVEPLVYLRAQVAPPEDPHDINALPLGFFEPHGYRHGLPRPLERALYPGWAGTVVWISLALAALLMAKRTGIDRGTWIVPLTGLASTVPHAVIVWDGDPTGLGRHGLLLAVVARICALLLIVFVVDAWLANRGTRRMVEASSSSGAARSR